MSMINTSAAEALIREQVLDSIFGAGEGEGSVFLRLARRLPNMTSNQLKAPVTDLLPLAYWVNGDAGMKNYDAMAWENVYLTAGELAVIVPISENVLSDAAYDIIGEVRSKVRDAIGKAVDLAVIFGVNRPAEWNADIITRARQAGNNVSGASVTYDSLLGASGVISKVEADGYMVNAGVAAMTMRGVLRGIKDSQNYPIFVANMQGATPYALDGAPLYFPTNGGFDTSVAQLVVGDWNQAVYSIRQDVDVKVLTEGVIQNPANGTIVYNLAQQDMIALRITFRMGWALPNPATPLNANRVGCPFAYLEPTTAATTYTATFTVKDTQSTPAAIEGAAVEVEGARLLTNASGQAVFNLRPGTYNYKVKAAGFKTQVGSITVTSSAVTQAVTLPNA